MTRAHVMATAPWRRAPFRLARQPRLLGAIVLVAVVVGLVAAAPVLFLSSVSSGALDRQLAPLCRGTSIDPGVSGGGDTTPIEIAADHVDGFAPIVTTTLLAGSFGSPLEVRTATKSSAVIIGTRTGYRDHIPSGVPVVGGEGIWLPDDTAAAVGVVAGDTVNLGAGDPTAPQRVLGVYPSFVQHGGFDGYWCALRPFLGTSTIFDDSIPPPLVIADDNLLAGLQAQLRLVQRDARIELPLATMPRTLSAARTAVDHLDQLEAAIPDYKVLGTSVQFTANTRLRYATRRADAIRTSVGGAVAPMSVVSGLVAIGLICGVTGSWLDRRRTEVRLLWVRGVSPWLIGLKGVLELLVPMVLGAVGGFAVALAVIRWLGPSANLDPGIVATAGLWVLVAFLVALAAVVVTTVVRLRHGLERAEARRRLAVPVLWEVPVLVLAAWSLHRFNDKGLPTVEGDTLPPIDVLSLLFPLLFLAGCRGLAARLMRILLSLTRRVGRRWPMAWYLAARRLAAESGAVLVLAGLAAMAVGVVVYGNGLVRSTNATVNAKTGVDLGSNIEVRFGSGDGVPAGLAGEATQVRVEGKGEYGDRSIDLLVVDPKTFAEGAYWDASLAPRSLAELMGELAAPTSDGTVPAIAVNGTVPVTGALVASDRPNLSAPVRVVATIPTFPGMSTSGPTLVLPEGGARNLEPRMNRVIWTKASADEVRKAASEAGRPIVYLVDADQITDSSPALPIVWTFLQALGVMVGLLAIVALVAYVDARQRARSVATALLARMGLGARGHWRSLVAELAVLGTVAVGLGTVLGWLAVRAVHRHLDPIPDRFPDPLLRFPWGAIGAATLVAAITVLLGAALAQRAAGRIDLGEALREDV